MILFRSLAQVFKRKIYVGLAVCVGLTTVIFTSLLPNFRLVAIVFSNPDASILEKLNIFTSLINSMQTNFSMFSAVAIWIVAILFGVNIAMVVYIVHQKKNLLQSGGITMSFGGLMSGIIGVGCASCGTVVLAPVLSVIGAGSLIAAMPFKGAEFSIISILILVGSIFLTSQNIQNPNICKRTSL
jgi:hypothetical protein